MQEHVGSVQVKPSAEGLMKKQIYFNVNYMYGEKHVTISEEQVLYFSDGKETTEVTNFSYFKLACLCAYFEA